MTSPSTSVVSRNSSPSSSTPTPHAAPAAGQGRPMAPDEPVDRYRVISRNAGQRQAARLRQASVSPSRPGMSHATFVAPKPVSAADGIAARRAARMSPPQVALAETSPQFIGVDSALAYQETTPLLIEAGSTSAFSNVSQATLRPGSSSRRRAQAAAAMVAPEAEPFAVQFARARQKIAAGLRDPAADGPSAACWLGISTLCLVSTTVLWTSWWMNGWREATVLGACLGAMGAFGFISAEGALTRTSQSLGDEVSPWMTGRHVAMQISWMVGSAALVAGCYSNQPALRRAGVAVLGAALYETDQTISRAAALANITPNQPPINPSLIPPPGNPLALAFLQFGSYLWGEGQELEDLNLAVYGMYVGLAGAAMAIEKSRMMSLLFTSIGWASIGQGAIDGRWQHWAMGLGAASVGFTLNLQANIHVLTAVAPVQAPDGGYISFHQLQRSASIA